jgi:hypothetical protein
MKSELLPFGRKAFKGAVEFLVAGPACAAKLSGDVQVVGMVTFMNPNCFLVFIAGKKGLQAGARLPGLGDSAMAVIFAEGIVAHRLYI